MKEKKGVKTDFKNGRSDSIHVAEAVLDQATRTKAFVSRGAKRRSPASFPLSSRIW
jgi:hypothetical protein